MRVKKAKSKLIPSEKQMEFIYSTAETTCLCAGRGFGKSVAAGYLAVNRLTHGASGLIMAPTYADLKAVLIRRILSIFDSYGYKKGRDFDYNGTDKTITVYDRNGEELSICYFRSTDDPECSRGLSDIEFLIIDEAAKTPKEARDVALATLRGEGIDHTQEFLISTPRGLGNWFSNVYNDPETRSIHASSYENDKNGKSFTKRLERTYTDIFYRQEVLGEIIDVTVSCVYTPDEVASIFVMKPWVKDELIAGLDVGGPGDPSVLSIRNGNKILYIQEKRTLETSDVIDWFKDVLPKYPIKRVYIDNTGIGEFLPKDLSKAFPDIDCVGVKFGGSPIKEGYDIRKSELFFDLKQKIKEGLYVSDDIDQDVLNELKVEICATEYKIDSKSNFKVNTKPEIKKKIGRSSDIIDSVALSCTSGSTITKQQVEDTRKYLSNSRRSFPKR